MKEPRFRIGTWFTTFMGIESFMFAFLTYYSFQFVWILCYLLIGLLLCILGFFTDFYIQYKEYYKATKDIMIRHTALSIEFDTKNKVLDEYETAFNSLGQMMIFAMAKLSQDEKTQFENLFRVLTFLKQNISGVKKNE